MKAFSRFLVVLVPVGLLLTAALYWRAHRNAPAAAPAPAPELAAAVPPASPAASAPSPVVAPGQPNASPALTTVASNPVRQLAPPMIAFESWAETFAMTAPAQQPALLKEGAKLAEARREAMVEMIRSDPERALRQALPYRLRHALPASIAAAIEQPVSGRGEFKAIHVDPLPEYQGQVATLIHEVSVDKTTYDAFTYGRRLAQPGREGLWLHGVAAAPDKGRPVMALSSEPLRPMEAAEVGALRIAGLIRQDAHCPVCGRAVQASGSPTVAEFGGEPITFCQPVHLQKMNRILAAAESRLTPAGLRVAGTPPDQLPPEGRSGTQGDKRLLLMPVMFVDDPVVPETEAQLQRTAERNNQYYVEGSYGTASFFTTVTPPLRLPYSKIYYGENVGTTVGDALAVAATLGYFARDYDHHYVVFNSLPQAKFGGRSDGLLNGGSGALSHELGHNFGLGHANYWDVSGAVPGPVQPRPPEPPYPIDIDSLIGHDDVNAPYIIGLAGSQAPIDEYGNIYDVMGSGGGHFSAAFKYQINWLQDMHCRDITNSSVNRVYAFDTPAIQDDRAYALRIYKDEERTYWITHRAGYPDNPWQVNGVEVQWDALLIDTTYTTASNRIDSAVTIGRTFSDPAASLHITPVAKGRSGPDPGDEYIEVVTHLGQFPFNVPPTLAINASDLVINTGQTVRFTANAQDANGDTLAYFWDFGDGTFSTSNAPVAARTFTNDGQWVVRCDVSDMKGGVASRFVVVLAGNPATFTMSGRVVDLYDQPVRGVRVHNSGSRTGTNATYRYSYTDSDGYYTIGNIPPGVYTNRAFLYGYICEPQSFDPADLSNGSLPALNHLAYPLSRVSLTRQEDAAEPDTVGRFTVSRDGDISQDLKVRFYASGMATVSVDYEPLLGMIFTNVVVTTNEGGEISTNITTEVRDYGDLVIPAGYQSIDLNVVPIDDPEVEGPESVIVRLALQTNFFTYSVTLTNVVNTNTVPPTTNTVFITSTNDLRIPGWELRRIGPNPTIGWVQTYPTYVLGQAEQAILLYDDEPYELPAVEVLTVDTDAVETRGDSAVLAFVRTGGDPAEDLVVRYTASGMASNGLDYVSLPGTITIPAWHEFALLPVVAIDDMFVEGNEEAEIAIEEDPAYQGGGGSASIVIVDDDLPLVTVYASDPVAEIGGGDPGRVTFARHGNLSESLQVNYLVSGTATSGVDIVQLPGTITIPVGQITASVNIATISNPDFVTPRELILQVSDSPTYNIAPGNSARVIIEPALPVVTLEASAESFSENDGSATLTFTRTGPTNALLLVYFAVGGTAVPGADYAGIGTNVLFLPGSDTATINVSSLDDGARENGDVTGPDRIIVQLLPGVNYHVGDDDNVTIAINDDDGNELPAASFMQRYSSVREDDGSAIIHVRLSANPETNHAPVLVQYRVVAGSAIPNVNYEPIPGGAGALSWERFTGTGDEFFEPEDNIRDITIPILDDGLAAGNKTLTLQLFNPQLYTTNLTYFTNEDVISTNMILTPVPTNAIVRDYYQHTLTIVDVGLNTVSISAATNLIFETGLAGAEFTITREGGTDRDLVVYLATSGIAAPGNDFVVPGTNGTITIPAGTNSVTFTLLPFDDPTEEAAESVFVNLVERPGYQVGSPDSASVLVVNNDGTIQFVKANYDVMENDGETTIGIQRTGDTNVAAIVDFRLSGGTASNGVDYVAGDGTLLFLPGEVLKTITFPILDDPRVEPVETVVFSLTNSSGGIPLGGQRNTTVFIHDDDSEFNLSGAAFFAWENSSNAAITVVRRGVVDRLASVELATADVTATNLVDYVGTNVFLEFLPGESNKLVLLPLLDDVLFEPDELVALSIGFASTNAGVGAISNALLTIRDDECIVEFTTNSVRVPEFAGSVRLDVRRTGGTINPVSVDFFTSDATATNGGDYSTVNGTLTFASGQVLNSITVPLLDDRFGEGPEYFRVHLTNVVNLAVGALVGSALLGSNDVVTVNLQDNETPGSLEVEWNPNQGVNARVLSVAQQSDGRTVFGGDFTELDETTLNRVARFTANGLLDPSFNPGFGANGPVHAVAIGRDDRIYIGGAFTEVDATNRNGLARLNAAGALDAGFTVGAGFNGLVRAIAPLADGSVLVGGDFTIYNSAARGHLVRLQTNGVLDAQFVGSVNGAIYSIKVQPDGRIVIGGVFDNVGGTAADCVARLTPNGAPDPGFAAPVSVNGIVRSVALQTDGRILVAGTFTGFDGSDYSYLARLNADGSLDSSFNTGTGPNAPVNSVTAHANGRIIIGGEFTTYNGISRNRFARLRNSGTVDQIFDIGTGADLPVLTTLVQSNTAVVIGGEFTTINNIPRRYIARIHGEEAMNVTEVGMSYSLYSVAENAGSLTVTIERFGNTNTAFDVEFLTADLTATVGADYLPTNGMVSFTNGQLTTNITVTILDDLLIEPDETFLFYVTNTPPGIFVADTGGAIVSIIDNEQSVRFGLAPYRVSEGDTNAVITVVRDGLPVGEASVGFRTESGTAQSGSDFLPVTTTVAFADGQSVQTVFVPIVDDVSMESNEVFQVLLENPSSGIFLGSPVVADVIIEDNELGPGTVDVTFTVGAGANDLVRALALQADGKVLVGGAFTSFDGTNRSRIARLNFDGTHDLGFNPGTGANGLVSSIGVRTDGRIAVAGAFSRVNGIDMNRVARLFTNGAVDQTFNRVAPFDANLNSLSVLSNGNLIVGGGFNLPAPGVTRLRSDGSADVSFYTGAGANGPVHSVCVCKDGSVVIGGGFTQVDNIPRRRVARIFANGLVDTGFVPPADIAGIVYAAMAQEDGRILVAGDFTGLAGTLRQGIARLNADGTLDTSFDPGSGANGIVYALALESDGDILIGGTFTEVNGVELPRLARLKANGTVDPEFEPGEGPNGTVYAIVVTPENKIVIGGSFTEVNGQPRIGVARLNGDEYEIRIISFSYAQGLWRQRNTTLPGRTYVLEASTDLNNWTALQTTVAGGYTLDFMESTSPGQMHRFYRVRQVWP